MTATPSVLQRPEPRPQPPGRRAARRGRQRLAGVGLTTAALGAATLAALPAAEAAECSDVDVVFARATGEPRGLGSLGRPFVQGVTQRLPGRSVSSFAVDYPADFAQRGDGAGATNLTQHVRQVAASCPNTQFVLGGYSQGASVVAIALGQGGPLGRGEQVPADLVGRVAAIAVFGNPARRFAGGPLNQQASPFAAKAIDLCNDGDRICSARGGSLGPHLRYQGAQVNRAVEFTAARLGGAGAGNGNTGNGGAGNGNLGNGNLGNGNLGNGNAGKGNAGAGAAAGARAGLDLPLGNAAAGRVGGNAGLFSFWPALRAGQGAGTGLTGLRGQDTGNGPWWARLFQR